jgi:hydroxymethylbilane synthase
VSDRILRIGTRESALALYQTNLVASWIAPVPTDIVGITTAGDNQHIPLTGQGTSGLFVNTLRNALIDGRVDLIVHSLKDVPTVPDERFVLAAVPQRVDVRDVFVGRDGMSIDEIPAGGLVGTSSPRRAAWVRRRRPDLRVEPIRGNVDTRLSKVARGDYDATLLAAAGLTRLGLLTDAMHLIDADELIPAPAQGALGVECRSADAEVIAVLSALDLPEARFTASAERAVLRELGATCATAAGAHSVLADGVLTLRADVMSTETLERIHVEYSVLCQDLDAADAAGVHVARQMLAEGAAGLVEMR